jgi:hypothetical protein
MYIPTGNPEKTDGRSRETLQHWCTRQKTKIKHKNTPETKEITIGGVMISVLPSSNDGDALF